MCKKIMHPSSVANMFGANFFEHYESSVELIRENMISQIMLALDMMGNEMDLTKDGQYIISDTKPDYFAKLRLDGNNVLLTVKKSEEDEGIEFSINQFPQEITEDTPPYVILFLNDIKYTICVFNLLRKIFLENFN